MMGRGKYEEGKRTFMIWKISSVEYGAVNIMAWVLCDRVIIKSDLTAFHTIE